MGRLESNKGTCLLGYSSYALGSWIWKSILKIRGVAHPFLSCKVGTGNSIFFWHENWTSLGPLIDLAGANGPRVTGIPRLATVFQAIIGTYWKLPRGRHLIIILLRACLPTAGSVLRYTHDEFLWRYSGSSPPGQFSSSLTWTSLHPETGLVDWWKSVWFTESIPKHSFIMWLAMRDKLTTRDILLSWGLQVPSAYLLCDDAPENKLHLFFICLFSSQIFRGMFLHHSIKPPLRFQDTFTWISNCSKPKRVKTICSILLQTIVYEVWKERNARLYSTYIKPVHVIIKEIQYIMPKKLYGLDRMTTVLTPEMSFLFL